MADKWQDLAGRLKSAGGGGAPRGLGLGMKLLGAAVAGVYGLQQSMYTGKEHFLVRLKPLHSLFHHLYLFQY
jgi:hypothetical protein